MRIIAGEAKGRKLYAPGGEDTRPTADRVRESVFGILGPRVCGARVLDLFGGTGALLGMRVFRHKTRHWKFRILVPLLAVAQWGLIAFIVWKVYA